MFLSSKICQDPVEKFFGCQRQRGGTHDNPTVAEFCQNTQALESLALFVELLSVGTVEGIDPPPW